MPKITIFERTPEHRVDVKLYHMRNDSPSVFWNSRDNSFVLAHPAKRGAEGFKETHDSMWERNRSLWKAKMIVATKVTNADGAELSYEEVQYVTCVLLCINGIGEVRWAIGPCEADVPDNAEAVEHFKRVAELQPYMIQL